MSQANYRRTRPWAAYLLLLTLSIGGYYLYAHSVVPLIEPATVARRAPVNTAGYQDLQGDNEHHIWFSENDWERRPCAVLLTTQGKILFDDCEAIDPKTWVVKPFSMVLHRASDAESQQPQPPIVLRCQDGATLRLEQPVSAFSKSNVQLKTAVLEGDVQLYRRKSVGSLADDLRIETSNVHIDNQSVSTIDDVAFWFGDNHGIGRQLDITLSRESGGGQEGFTAINGISNLRMGLLSTMQLNPQQTTTGAKSDRLLSTDKSPIQINTRGAFEFDFQANIARFRDQISVRKLDNDNDELRCDELLLKFKSQPGQSTIQLSAASDNEYELQSIVAKGSPVVLNAASQNATINCELLKYDIAAQVVQVSDSKGVSIRRADTLIEAQSLQYQLTDDDRLGQLSAVGPGKLTKQSPEESLAATWTQSLTLQRQNEDKHLLQILGNVSIDMGDGTQMSADRFDMSLWEVAATDSAGKFDGWAYQVENLKAKNQVRIVSEKLIADAKELIATWPENPRPVQRTRQPRTPAASQKTVSPAGMTSPARKTIIPVNPNARRFNFKPDNTWQQVPAGQQPVSTELVATGDLIEVIVTEDNDEPQISDLTISGNVVVQKPSSLQADHAELTVTGDSLHLLPQPDQQYRIQVSGTQRLARIQTDQFHVDGKEVFLDQTENRMWINGQGQVILNGANDRPAIANLQQPDNLKISFAGGMIFDGQNIYFEYGILADIQQSKVDSVSQIRATGNALKITLDEKIDFNAQQNKQNRPKPKIQELIFRGAPPKGQARFQFAGFNANAQNIVYLENEKRGIDGKLEEKLKLNSPHVTLSRRVDKLTALGPGDVEIYRKGSASKGSGLGFISEPTNTNAITYVHMLFSQDLTTGIESKNLAVRGSIRSLYAKVDSFDASFDPVSPINKPAGAVQLFCNRVDLIQSKNPLAPGPRSEFIATGSAHIIADDFATKADKINYRDDTSELVVEGLPGRNVQIKLRDSPGSEFREFSGPRVTYNVKTKTAVANSVERLSAPLPTRPSR